MQIYLSSAISFQILQSRMISAKSHLQSNHLKTYGNITFKVR